MARARWLTVGLLGSLAMGPTVGCAPPLPVAGLRPEYPKADYTFVRVDSRQPTLRWESFPRPGDLLLGATGRPALLEDLTYELRIWRAEDRVPPYPGDLVYSRQGLPTPHHTVESPLEPRTDYLWSVRARFSLDGQPRVLEWGVMVGLLPEQGSRAPRIPPRGYYRFRTPG